MKWYSHLHLLVSYVAEQKPNVHGGYFEGLFSQQLIYRLACLGFDETLRAYGGPDKLWKACTGKADSRAGVAATAFARDATGRRDC